MSDRSNLPATQLQAEAEAPDLRSQQFQRWREVALEDHQDGTNHQSVRARIQSLNLDQILVELNEEPEPEEEHFPKECEVLWKEMKEAFAIKTGKARRNEAVSNTGTLTFINNWWEWTG